MCYMEKKNKISIIVPWYYSSWTFDFENTKKLAEQLKLNTIISIDKPPISIGTVFWCRTEALGKLMTYQWKYEDFPEEPLQKDGTINHAIERILPYVAQDAGYETGIVLTETSTSTLLSFVQFHFQRTFDYLHNYMGIRTLYQLYHINRQKDIFLEYFTRHVIIPRTEIHSSAIQIHPSAYQSSLHFSRTSDLRSCHTASLTNEASSGFRQSRGCKATPVPVPDSFCGKVDSLTRNAGSEKTDHRGF